MGNKVVEYITKVLLVVLAAIAIYSLYGVIKDPIMAKKKRLKRKKMVIERLEKGREAQKTFKDVNGRYAGSWDTLMHFVKRDTLPVVSTKGDPNDTTQQIQRDTVMVPVKKSLFPNYPVDSIQYAPMTGKKFKIDADKIKQRGVAVNVFEIKDVKPILEDKTLKVGSMQKAVTSGNW